MRKDTPPVIPLETVAYMKVDCLEVVERGVRPSGNGAIVYVPRKWVGGRVKVYLLKKEESGGDIIGEQE